MSSQVRGAVLVLQPRESDVGAAVCASGRGVHVVEPEREDRERVIEAARRGGWSDVVTTAESHDTSNVQTTFASVVFSPAACAAWSKGMEVGGDAYLNRTRQSNALIQATISR